MGPVEPNFSFAQHTVQLEEATDVDVILVDAKLVGSVFNSGGKIEPVAPLECMHTPHPTHAHVEAEMCLQLFNLNSFRPTEPELP